MPNFSDMTDAELAAWVNNFTTVVGANPSEYGLTAAQVTDFTAKNDDFVAKITAHITAEDAATAAIKARDASRKPDESLASYYNTIIKANTDISDAAKSAAGIDVKKPSTHTPPVTPLGLTVNGYQDGTNILKWEGAGNKQGTQYIVEYRPGTETDFKYLGLASGTTYTHEDAVPGEQCAYRVKAQRANQQSTYSNVAIIYMA